MPVTKKQCQKEKKRVSLIISTRNDFENLKKLLDTIFRMTYKFHEILVFDDASEDNTSEKILYHFDEVENFNLITFANEKGFPVVRNEGILRAEGDFLMFLNSDFFIDETSLMRLIDEASHYNIVYPVTKDFSCENFQKFRKAHENFIKFSHCFIMQKNSLYCFKGVFYDSTFSGIFCDFDFFSKAQVYGLTSCLIEDSEIKKAPVAQSLENAGNRGNGKKGESKKEEESRILYQAIYKDMKALETIRLILAELDEVDSIPVNFIADMAQYINKKRLELKDNNNSFYYRYRDSYSRKISNSHFTLIEITNACIRRCSHCTRGVSLVKEPHYMSLEEIEVALKSLKGWKRAVGLFGGEPTLHPDFLQICELLEKYFPKEQRAIFTCGGPVFEKHKELIDDKFGVINYNEHSDVCHHQPVFVASDEVMTDKKMLDVLIRRCWVGQIYCHIITNRGGFFCEVAATLDHFHDGDKGFKLEEGWWKKGIEEYADQVNEYCTRCGMCLPLDSRPDNCKKEIMTPKQYNLLKDKLNTRHLEIEIFNETYDNESIFAKTGSLKENYTDLSSKSFWYKENFLDTRKNEPEKKRLMSQ